jgi:hypothetical protein
MSDTAIVVVGKGPAVIIPRDEAHTLDALMLRMPLNEGAWRTWAEWAAL